MKHYRNDSVISVCHHTEESSTNTESTRDVSCCSSPSSATVVSSVVFGNGVTTNHGGNVHCSCRTCLKKDKPRSSIYRCNMANADQRPTTKERCCFSYERRCRSETASPSLVGETENYCSHLARYRNSVRLARVVVGHLLNAALLIVSINACFSSTGQREGQWFSITTFVNRSCMVIGTLLPFVGSLLHNVGRERPPRSDTVHMQSVFVGYLVVVVAQSTAYRVQNHYDVEFHMALLSNTTLLTLHGALLLTLLARRYSLFKINAEECRLLHRCTSHSMATKTVMTTGTSVNRCVNNVALCTCDVATCTAEEASGGETVTDSARSSPNCKMNVDRVGTEESTTTSTCSTKREPLEEDTDHEPVTPYETLEKFARASIEPYLVPNRKDQVSTDRSNASSHSDYVPFEPCNRSAYTIENETDSSLPDINENTFKLKMLKESYDVGLRTYSFRNVLVSRDATRTFGGLTTNVANRNRVYSLPSKSEQTLRRSRLTSTIHRPGNINQRTEENLCVPESRNRSLQPLVQTMQEVSRAVELLNGMLEFTPFANNTYSSYVRNVTTGDIYACSRLARFVEAIYYRCRDTFGESEFDSTVSACVGVPAGYSIDVRPYLHVYNQWATCMKRLSAGSAGTGLVEAIRKESTTPEIQNRLQGTATDDAFRGG